jgi:hypothetical protein
VTELVQKVGGSKETSCIADAVCCTVFGFCGLLPLLCGRVFRTGVGNVDLWVDSNKRPLALEPNQWQNRPNW